MIYGPANAIEFAATVFLLTDPGGNAVCANKVEPIGSHLLEYLGRPPEHSVRIEMTELSKMAVLKWAQCFRVESIPGKGSGAWVFKESAPF